MSEATRILQQIDAGDPSAAEQLLPLVYEELRKLAARRLAGEQSDQTLQPTALVHEAYLRLVGGNGDVKWDSRGHFFAAAAEAMRRILVESARRKGRQIHGGGMLRVELADAHGGVDPRLDELLAIDEALERLAAEDAQAAHLVKLRYFAGMSVEEASELMGISPATGYRHWAYARAWIRCEVLGQPGSAEKKSAAGESKPPPLSH